MCRYADGLAVTGDCSPNRLRTPRGLAIYAHRAVRTGALVCLSEQILINEVGQGCEDPLRMLPCESRYPLQFRGDGSRAQRLGHRSLQRFCTPIAPSLCRVPWGWFPVFLGTTSDSAIWTSIPVGLSYSCRPVPLQRSVFVPWSRGSRRLRAWGVLKAGLPHPAFFGETSRLPRFLGGPSSACPALRPRRRVGTQSLRSVPIAFRQLNGVGLRDFTLSGLYHTAHGLALHASRPQSPVAALDPLPAGDHPCPGGIGYPQGPSRRFPNDMVKLCHRVLLRQTCPGALKRCGNRIRRQPPAGRPWLTVLRHSQIGPQHTPAAAAPARSDAGSCAPQPGAASRSAPWRTRRACTVCPPLSGGARPQTATRPRWGSADAASAPSGTERRGRGAPNRSVSARRPWGPGSDTGG